MLSGQVGLATCPGVFAYAGAPTNSRQPATEFSSTDLLTGVPPVQLHFNPPSNCLQLNDEPLSIGFSETPRRLTVLGDNRLAENYRARLPLESACTGETCPKISGSCISFYWRHLKVQLRPPQFY